MRAARAGGAFGRPAEPRHLRAAGRYHVIVDKGELVAACNRQIILTDAPVKLGPATVPPEQRCQRAGCRQRWDAADEAPSACQGHHRVRFSEAARRTAGRFRWCSRCGGAVAVDAQGRDR